jgi:hypothetical protein
MAEKCHGVRWLATVVQSGKIAKSFGETGGFGDSYGFPHNLEVVGSNPAPATFWPRSESLRPAGSSEWRAFLNRVEAMIYKHSRAAPLCVVVALLAVPLLYVVSYAALVDPSGRLEMGDDGVCRPQHYRYGGRVAEAVYWPAREVDRQWRLIVEEDD